MTASPPPSLVDDVDPLIGTTGEDPCEYGGMVPSTAPPFAMTRWTPMTRENLISACPYHHDDERVIGFIGSHQPAIWMGDWGSVVVAPGVGEVRPDARDRGLVHDRATEVAHPASYAVDLLVPGDIGRIRTRLTGTSRVGVLELVFDGADGVPLADAHVVVQATRAGFTGEVAIDPERREISGYNPERQDAHLGPPQAASFAGYFVARFDVETADDVAVDAFAGVPAVAGTASLAAAVAAAAAPDPTASDVPAFASWGTAVGAELHEGETHRRDEHLAAWVRFPAGTRRVVVRTGVSLISVEQARANLDAEVPDGVSVDDVVEQLRTAWAERLDLVRVEGASPEERTNLATALFHALQYPARLDEGDSGAAGARRYYNGYRDAVQATDRPVYTAFSLWDTFRAQNALLTLLAPAELPDMMASLLASYSSSGWLPIWENLVETNIMVGTHADSILAEAVLKGVDVDVPLAFEAAYKNASVPPDGDTERWWGDRELDPTPSARAGLTRYLENGWVAADETAEAGSRTLDYAFDDHAVAVLADAAGRPEIAAELRERAQWYRNVWNAERGFMQSRNRDGSWAEGGWTEGTQWPYTFQVLHDARGLRDLMGVDLFRARLDGHFAAGWNRHDNEPSHHIPYLFSYAGQPWKTAEHTRRIARESYLATPDGLCGNDDLGQMSAWYVFTALGFYPVNPASTEYVVGAPLFDRLEVDLPGAARPLVVVAPGAPTLPYVAALRVDGREVTTPFLQHAWIADGAVVEFTMSAEPTDWGTELT
ncbi:alpha-1,2-mannosidase [Beutenbergia cavernae DSM 12333]|uniref:Alpha-1,2-mannosidase n=1 Tax=Beutenbergia cavernae (strain ATCC BAA-8 / DSM 12333 / CCUG 43141 / JCM 11478 / NBRC 16432 / NCIMB 13614 / HKI 0122) TaxID=471853 RepID=C5BV25_BEUC1|nr:GH92 family glycosyl hydrolase [Beutenbergia cavernae]ACQ78399.1 alpha-1,2-mannosidase [Beutenbergia cavernae DSM 12333]